ncbi:MAG TPA: flagellar hook basal-body protein [Novosphingobium sp.]
MNGTFYIGATGIEAQQRALDVTANNIVNINTPAFKRSSVRFAEMVATPREATDLPIDLDPIAMLSGVRAQAGHLVWAQGDLKQTGSVLDIAIQGNGFIEVLGNDGEVRLWRGGTLKVNNDGFLGTSDGLPLRAMISIPAGATDLTIAGDGTVTARTSAEEAPERLGGIELALVEDLDRLTAVSGGYFERPGDASVTTVLPEEEGGGRIVQGAIEGSNVDLSEQMVSLMLLQRSYAANAQLLQAGDQIMAILNNLRK